MSVQEAAPPAGRIVSPPKQTAISMVDCHELGQASLLYPMFVVPLLLWGATSLGLDGKTAVWIWLATFAVVITALVWNLNRVTTIIIVITIVLMIVSALLADSKWGIPVFPWIGEQLKRIPLSWSPEFQSAVYAIAAICGLFFVIEMISSRLDGYWIFNKNEFEHYSFGRKDTSYARGQNTVVTLTPCVLKSWLLFGGATLQITGAQDQRPHAIVTHVFRGQSVGVQIRKMLESLRVTDDSGISH